jgi:hypothetical protein
MIVCVSPDCRRAPMPSTPDGTRYAMCSQHTCDALLDAFGPAWHDRARAHTLPTSITGGSDRQTSAVDVPLRVDGAGLDARAASPGIGTG